MIPKTVHLAPTYKGYRVGEYKLASFTGTEFEASFTGDGRLVDGVAIQRSTSTVDKYIELYAVGIKPTAQYRLNVALADTL